MIGEFHVFLGRCGKNGQNAAQRSPSTRRELQASRVVALSVRVDG
jgi:hypothetical protein